MNTARTLIGVGAASLLLALVGCDDDVSATPEDDPSPTVAGTTATAPSPGSGNPVDLVGYRGPLDPGRYSMAAWGPDGDTRLPRAVLEVPTGYFSNGGWAVDAGSDTFEPDQFGEIMVWPVTRVFDDTCDDTRSTRVGPTARDLARALAAQDGSTTTRPRPVTLDGHDGLYLELTTPDTDAGCTSHTIWRNTPEYVYGQDTGGLVHHLWILDIDGTRLVIAVSNYPDQAPEQHQELIDIAETIHFTGPTGS
jgi:hypothetical protein